MTLRLRCLLPSLLLLFSACSALKVEPQRQYYTVNQVYVGMLQAADTATQNCIQKEVSHPCRRGIPPLQDGVRVTKKAFAETDKVFAAGDASYYNLAVLSAEATLKNLSVLIAKVQP